MKYSPHHSNRPGLLLMILVLVTTPLKSQTVSPVLAPYATQVQLALDHGYGFLLSQQRGNGSFPGEYGGSAGVVALTGMSFLAAGYTPGDDEYGQFIYRCIDYVLAQQNEHGYILTGNRKDQGMYSHNISTLFLAEVSGMLKPETDQKVHEALAKAVRVILQAQDVKKKKSEWTGGWRYTPGTDQSDLSVSGWAVMALRAARLNGARVPEGDIQQAVQYILNLQSKEGSFGYQRREDRDRVSLTGLAVLCLTLTGQHDHPAVRRAENYILKNYKGLAKEPFEVYGLYYTTQAAFQLGGESWRKIGEWMYKHYLPKQRDDGSWGGSVGGTHRSEKNTPVYNTSMVLLSLTVPYRQLPIYQRDETVDE